MDTLPAGVTFVSATAGGTLSGNVVTWPAIASLGSGGTQAYGVTVTAPAHRHARQHRGQHRPPRPTPVRPTTTARSRRVARHHHGGGAGRRRHDQDRPGNGQRRAELQLRAHGRRTPARAPPRNVVVTDTLPGRRHVRERHGRRRRQRQRGDLAGHREPATGGIDRRTASRSRRRPAARCSTSRRAPPTTADPDPSEQQRLACRRPGSRTIVIAQADVATTKTGPATVNAGQNFSYAVARVEQRAHRPQQRWS